jgi:Arc/MetJ-type ribon-helix-helix transcriptional regulator
MMNFDYSAPAELFATHGRAGLRYRRFSKAAEAIRYAVEKLPGEALHATSIEVDQQRYDSQQIRALYENEGYPLARK